MESRDNKERQSKSEPQADSTPRLSSRLPPRLPPRLPKSAPVHRGRRATQSSDRPEHTPQLTRKLRLPGTPISKPKSAGHTLKMAPVSALPEGKRGTPISSSNSSALNSAIDLNRAPPPLTKQGANQPSPTSANSISLVHTNDRISSSQQQTSRTSLVEFGPTSIPMPELPPGADQKSGAGESREDTVVLDVSSSNTILAGDSVVGTIDVDNTKRNVEPDVSTRRQPLINVSKPFDPLVELNSELQRLDNEEGTEDDDTYDQFPTLSIKVGEIDDSKSANNEFDALEDCRSSDAKLQVVAENEGLLDREIEDTTSAQSSIQVKPAVETKVHSKGLALLGLAICTMVVFAVAIQQGASYGSPFGIRSISENDEQVNQGVDAEHSTSLLKSAVEESTSRTTLANKDRDSRSAESQRGRVLLNDPSTTTQDFEQLPNKEGQISQNDKRSSAGRESDPRTTYASQHREIRGTPSLSKRRKSVISSGSKNNPDRRATFSNSGIFVDRVVVGHARGARGCEAAVEGFSALKHRRTNLCFQINRRSRDREVLVRWSRNGVQVRQTKQKLRPDVRKQQIRAFLQLQPGLHEGSWKVQVLSKKGAELASKAFKVVE